MDVRALDRLLDQAGRDAATIHAANLKIQALTLELAHHRRMRFGNKSEAFSPEQRHLFQETWDSDLSAIEAEFEQLGEAGARQRILRSARAPAISPCPHTCRASSTGTNRTVAHAPAAGRRW